MSSKKNPPPPNRRGGFLKTVLSARLFIIFTKVKSPELFSRDFKEEEKGNEYEVIRRTGSYRLSRVLRRSTIGDEGFNGRVRDGIGWDTFARPPIHLITSYEKLDLLYLI